MTLKELCAKHNTTQTKLSRRFGIGLRTVQGWYLGEHNPPAYLVAMMDEILTNEPLLDKIKNLIAEEAAK